MNASSLAVGEICRQARNRLGGWLVLLCAVIVLSIVMASCSASRPLPIQLPVQPTAWEGRADSRQCGVASA